MHGGTPLRSGIWPCCPLRGAAFAGFKGLVLHTPFPCCGVSRLETDTYQTFPIVGRCTEIVVKECHRPFHDDL
ncbi:hypothetical protein DN523_26785 [Burkholderia multivorans]|uniref:Uncharacterized protein n=1 Tax=Burkholderia multivorans TaxID=87883 RepID=A0A228DRR4_9BURK|nr:hypothetical protein A8H40_29155 [Burkholderia multivorans]EEE00899.1 hypothetical protein BURMUCGD1_0294 [Burkholderia multivorans CGD1]EJO57940.1 hypothetical protein BURMUCF2_2997 [Burkholderia multivorans CF2]AYY60160.1 hypothetical protein EGY20_26630 [Burkholderia multivorans]AYY98464.1 hypothetical protein EGY19_14080 [Burkholderia multivorans]